MSTALLDTVQTDELDLFELDLDVSIEKLAVNPMITSVSLCTPGCTSRGGGSNCSFCC